MPMLYDADPEFKKAYSLSPEQLLAYKLFLPTSLERRQQAFRRRLRFVHYTSAEAAIKIAQSKKIWLRNVRSVNDYNEINFGIDRVLDRFSRNSGADLWKALDTAHAGISERIFEIYDSWRFDYSLNTYVTCVSEHCPTPETQIEDQLGRLSMWRAYGGQNGVAIVIRGDAFHSTSVALGAFSYPVEYKSQESAKMLFEKSIHQIHDATSFLKSLPSQMVVDLVIQMLESFSLALKHPAFEEEREWRIVYRPAQNPSKFLNKTVQIISGVPQIVYELPLEGTVDNIDLNFASIVDRVLIGPTRFSSVTYDAIVEAFSSAGVKDAASKVTHTDIPLRT